MQTPLSNARGLGSAGKGSAHWWTQRVTSVALVPLALWFGFSLSGLPDFLHSTITTWMRQPLTPILLIAFLIVGCYHMALGLRVIAEDYIHGNLIKVTTIVLFELVSFAVALTGVISIIKISL